MSSENYRIGSGSVTHRLVETQAAGNATPTLPVPPLEYRRLVGPTDAGAFDNPNGGLVFPQIPSELYESVFDFGCGCGRIARQLIQQQSRPCRYRGIDAHPGMVQWCRANLTPHAPQFEFLHHNVFQEFMNPGGDLDSIPLPAADRDVTLFVAWSIFTHLFPADVHYYLSELARVLHPAGVAVTTWFFFDKRDFPMMQEFQNALYINELDPTNAVILDRTWFCTELRHAGLIVTRSVPPVLKGHQWLLYLQQASDSRAGVGFPDFEGDTTGNRDR